MQLRVNGIYNQYLWQELKLLDIHHFGFNFIPTHFAFLPQYQFLDLAQKNFNQQDLYYFSFMQEKDFIVQKQLDDCEKLLAHKFGGGDILNHFQLSFSQYDSVEFAESFELGYWLPFDFEQNMNFFYATRFLKGLIFNYDQLAYLKKQNLWGDFLTLYRDFIKPFVAERHIKLALAIDWDSDIFPSLLDSVKFDYIDLEINSKVEQSYRQPDMPRLQELINFYKEQFCE